MLMEECIFRILSVLNLLSFNSCIFDPLLQTLFARFLEAEENQKKNKLEFQSQIEEFEAKLKQSTTELNSYKKSQNNRIL
jgi:hypothetical protein